MSSIVPQHGEQDIDLVEDDHGASAPVWCEAPVLGSDFEAVVMDLLEGKCKCRRRVAVFNLAQGWVRDASAEVVHELRRRCDLQLRDIPEALHAFTDRYEGCFADMQLPLPIPIGI
ncbi:hypothetical protein [Bradyrhizobium sp. Arg816]|uniref:hypothetical protein n=1 Tax=Bradyrhizobium sp. Arg816 TaxID=2998491 RepID=UPI00249E7A81|nr:hypothetical protein [Bradyrhizobium sp. Arg816]MDI3562384.1 hypothetical protein [Bradyrhizobium sp. Arg816]